MGPPLQLFGLLVICIALCTPQAAEAQLSTATAPQGAAPPGAAVATAAGYLDLLPTGTAQPPVVTPLPAAPAETFPTVASIPTVKQASAGQCAANFAVGQQCGGNMTNAAANCTAFASCSTAPAMGIQWAGGCCPANTPCAALGPSGNFCWSCGGSPPKSLTTASDNVATAGEKMCNRLVDSDFDYGCVLGASLMFYEAQRSGKLPANNRIPWRGNSALLDKAPNGASIVGGWYDAGDLTRFTFPAAFTVSTLALGFLEFPDAFQQSKQVDYMLDTLRWGADWLYAARYAPDAFVAVTWMPGSAQSVRQSHLYWGRPEEVQGAAAVRALTSGMRGADLLAQGAAALAAVAVVFKDRDPTYANELLSTAQGLYSQAIDSEGLYSNSIPEVRGYYESYSYIDDLAWAATWLALATDDPEQWEHAAFYYNQHWQVEGGGEMRRYDYNNMVQAVGYLLAKHDPSKKEEYSKPIREVMDKWLTAQSNISYTPKGMAYIDSWGNLRYVANQAFMGLLHNKLYPEQSHRATVYTCFARRQARIMLGETGQSYVVGIGNTPPCRPHHRAASCLYPSTPGLPCDCTAYFNPGCNPNTIYGALVGGPNRNDEFTDTRWDFMAAEVALDWNAGFTGMLAGLASNPISWDACKAARMEDGRGDVSPSLNAAVPAGPVGVWWQVLAAVAVMWVVATVQQQH